MPCAGQAVAGSEAMSGPRDHLAGGYRRPAYLARLEVRRLKDDTKRYIVFGLGVGWIITLFSFFQYRFVPFVYEPLWLVLTGIGISVIATAVIIPSLLHWLERVWMAAARHIGKTIFTILLLAVFYILIAPVGLLWRVMKGTAPFYSWATASPPADMEGWTKKIVPVELEAGEAGGEKRALLTQPARVLAYFVRQGHYLLLPTMVIIIILGMLMFFVHTSTLAPFIYTLF
ncbi:MAG: hypothetical protein D8M59_02130 [Planctomycetes bacterium]|nr:hypothetical protein [Planctomycetota bacterium]